MKNNICITIVSFICCLALAACEKEHLTPDDTISCDLVYENHIKNSEYQNLLDNYTANGLVGITLLTNSPVDNIWVGASGYADIEDNVKMTACHLHHTASIYKTYIAVIIMQLSEEGHFDLDDKAYRYLPAEIMDELPNGNTFTIRQLLQQRTGLPDIFEVDFILDFFNNPTKLYTIEELLEYVYGQKETSLPGTEFYYSDANYALLSLLINKIEGSYEQALHDRIFEPLNLTETYFIDNSNEAPAGLADSYWDRYGNGKVENMSDIQIGATAGFRGTDGIISSAVDLQLFIQGLFDGSLLSASSLEEMTEFVNVTEEVQEQHGMSAYGLGLMKVKLGNGSWYGHFGNHVGSGAIVLYNPSKDLTIVAFINKGTFFSQDMKPLFFGEFLLELEAILTK